MYRTYQLKRRTASQQASTMASAPTLESLVVRLENAVARLEALDGKKSTATVQQTKDREAPVAEVPLVLSAFDEVIAGPLQSFLSLSDKLGGKIKVAADLLQEAFVKERTILLAITKCKVFDKEKNIKLRHSNT